MKCYCRCKLKVVNQPFTCESPSDLAAKGKDVTAG